MCYIVKRFHDETIPAAAPLSLPVPRPRYHLHFPDVCGDAFRYPDAPVPKTGLGCRHPKPRHQNALVDLLWRHRALWLPRSRLVPTELPHFVARTTHRL